MCAHAHVCVRACVRAWVRVCVCVCWVCNYWPFASIFFGGGGGGSLSKLSIFLVYQNSLSFFLSLSIYIERKNELANICRYVFGYGRYTGYFFSVRLIYRIF